MDVYDYHSWPLHQKKVGRLQGPTALPAGKKSRNRLIGGWMGSKTGLNPVKHRKISRPCKKSNSPGRSPLLRVYGLTYCNILKFMSASPCVPHRHRPWALVVPEVAPLSERSSTVAGACDWGRWTHDAQPCFTVAGIILKRTCTTEASFRAHHYQIVM